MKPPHTYLVNAALACAVLYWVADLSRSERTLVDWVVIGIVAAAVLYNLVQLGRRRHGAGGGKALSHRLRALPRCRCRR